MTEREGLDQSEGASGKLIDQRRGNVRRRAPGRGFMHASRLLQLHLPGNYYYEKEFSPSPLHNSKPVTHSQQESVKEYWFQPSGTHFTLNYQDALKNGFT